MIDATSENIWYKKKKHRFKFKRFFSFVTVFSFIIGLYLFYDRAITEQIVHICSDYAYSYSTDSVNKSVLISLSDRVKYEDLVSVHKNAEGEIVLMSTNSYKVNIINREVALSTQKMLEDKLDHGVPVPLFAFTGISLLAGYGKPVDVQTLSVSSVQSKFSSEFKSVGINQTLHSIYVDVDSLVILEMPFRREQITCNTSVLLCETVLVGAVPETYLSGDLFSVKNG